MQTLQLARLINNKLFENNFFQPGWASSLSEAANQTAIVVAVSPEIGFIFQIEEVPNRPGWILFRSITTTNSWYGQKVVHSDVAPISVENWFLMASLLQDYVNYMLLNTTTEGVRSKLEMMWNLNQNQSS